MRTLMVVAALLLPLTVTATDPKDTGGKLDLRSAQATRKGTLLRLTVTTYGPWASKLLRSGSSGPAGPRPGLDRLTVLYDVNGDGKADFTGRIVYRSKLALWLTGRGSSFEPIPVKRPTGSSVSFVHPVDAFFPGGHVKTVRLAITSVTSAGLDRLPNRGWIRVAFG
jgi:hypothetical protein